MTGRDLARWVLRARWPVLALVALISIAALLGALRVRFDADIEIWFLKDDPALVTYHEFLDEFASDEISVLCIVAEDVFAPGVLRAIDRVTRAAEDAPYVNRVHSLTNVRVVESQGPFQASVNELIDELPRSAAEAERLRKRALANVLVRDFVVAPDGRAAGIIVEMDPAGNESFENKARMVRALRDIANEHVPAGLTWHLAGSTVLDEAFYDYTERDFSLLAPAAAIVALLVCFALFRRPMAAVLPLVIVLLANLWLFGLMGWLGIDINIVSTSLFAVVLAVGIADTVHVLSEFQQELTSGRDKNSALSGTIEQLLTPCLFTSLTTIAGFLSLTVSDLQPIAQFGWLAATGIAFALLLSLGFAPALLGVLPAAAVGPPAKGRLAGARLLGWLGRPGRRGNRVVLGIAGALAVSSVVSIMHMQTGANPMNYFKAGDPVRQSTYRVDEHLGGSASYELYVKTEPGGLKEPGVLERLSDLQQRMEKLPAVTRVFSVLDSLKETRRVLTDGQPESARLPDSRPMAAQLYLVIEGDDDFARYVRGDYERARMTTRVKLSQSGRLTARVDDIETWLRRDFQDDQLHVEATGFVKLMSDMEHYLLQSQMHSLSLAFIVVTLMLLLLLRSFKLMLFSLIPNFLPVVMGLGLMGVAGIALDPGTVMIGSMALGLVVDDTVHFLVRLRRNVGHRELPQAIDATMQQTGRPIIFTSLILAAGLSLLMLGSFTPNVYFGLVSAFVILMALLADLLVLPAALDAIRPRLSSRPR